MKYSKRQWWFWAIGLALLSISNIAIVIFIPSSGWSVNALSVLAACFSGAVSLKYFYDIFKWDK